MLNTHYKKELLDYLYERKANQMKELSALKKANDNDDDCTEYIYDAKKECKEQFIYILDNIINKYLHISA